jgi:ABC-2 type transport system permease protein
MTAFANHFSYEFKTGLRNPSLLLMNYLFPLAFYALMGLVMTQINPPFRATLIPAMIVVTLMTSTLLGLPGPQVEAREAGVYRSFRINGVPALSILAMPALSAVFHALIASLIISVTAAPLFNGAAPTNPVAFALVTVLAAFTFGAIGSLIGVISPSSRATVLWSQIIYLPSMILGGLMLPTSLIPESMRAVAMLLPTTYVMQAFQGLAYGAPTLLPGTTAVAILVISGLLAFGLAGFLFNWDSHNDVRRGHPLMALLVLAPFVAGIFLH